MRPLREATPKMKIFNEIPLSALLRDRIEKASHGIMTASEKEILGADEAKYVEDLVKKHQIEPLIFHWDQLETSDREEVVPANRVPGFGGYPGERTQIQVVIFHLPYEGDSDLLRAQPNSRILWTLDITPIGRPRKEITFDVRNVYRDAQKVKADADRVIDNIKVQVANVNNEAAQFNSELPRVLDQTVRARREKLRSQADTLGALGFPVRKKS